jgi:hypothetical protein
MLSYATYKIFHYVGLAMVLSSLGALIVHQNNVLSKRTIAITHGLGLLLLLISGFGALAKLQIHSIPLWVAAKLGLWLLLGGYMALVPRLRNRFSAALWFGLPLTMALGAYLAQYKPF